MNRRRYCCIALLIMMIGFSVPVYGAESSLAGQGNIKGLDEQIKNMKEDYTFLENEIARLTDSEKIEVNAQNLNRRSGIVSKGNIQFENGEVYVTASDFLYLADEIDRLESTYKCTLVDALNAIGTYFKNDGTVTYDSSQNEINSEGLKTNLSISNIKQGILSSQSVESVKQVQAIDKEGNPLYFANEEANNNKERLNFATIDTGFPIFYTEATADNLSAGTAAWVNGVLLKGNGEDNKRSWQNGYNEGYTKGVADSFGKANIVYTYHEHSGNSSQEGGCYGTLTGSRPIVCECNSYAYTDVLGVPTCTYCFHNHAGGKCWFIASYEPYSYIGLVCGKTEQTIESATIVY